MNNSFSILIVGGGVSSLLVCQQILSIKNLSCKIQIVHSNVNFPKGTAYSPISDRMLLNVPAGKMSLMQDNPNHFVEWLKNNVFDQINYDQLEKEFVPRSIYGKYIDFVWEELIQIALETNHSIECILDTIEKVKRINDTEYRSYTKNETYLSNAVILATGNELPRNPMVNNMNYIHSKRYFHNPWNVQIDSLNPEKQYPLVILGTGLTMVDTVLELNYHFPRTKIYALSRKGYSIMAHNTSAPSNEELKLPIINNMDSLLQIVSKINKYRKVAAKNGFGIDQLFLSIRLNTNAIWASLTSIEKKVFYERLRHMWGVARHRVPIQSFLKIQKLRKVNQLEILPVTITSIIDHQDYLTIEYIESKSKTIETVDCSFIINCTGPESDIFKMDNPLITNLEKDGLIKNDSLNLGVLADSNTLELFSVEGKKQDNLFGIGNLLRGTFWESTALEELKIQAKKIKTAISKN